MKTKSRPTPIISLVALFFFFLPLFFFQLDGESYAYYWRKKSSYRSYSYRSYRYRSYRRTRIIGRSYRRYRGYRRTRIVNRPVVRRGWRPKLRRKKITKRPTYDFRRKNGRIYIGRPGGLTPVPKPKEETNYITYVYRHQYEYQYLNRFLGRQLRDPRHSGVVGRASANIALANQLARQAQSIAGYAPALDRTLKGAEKTLESLVLKKSSASIQHPDLSYRTLTASPVDALLAQLRKVEETAQRENRQYQAGSRIWRTHAREDIAGEMNSWVEEQTKKAQTKFETLATVRTTTNPTRNSINQSFVQEGKWNEVNLGEAFECLFGKKGFYIQLSTGDLRNMFADCIDCFCETNL